MRVELLEYPGERDWIEVYRRALVTVGKDTVKIPSDEWKRKILAARHSPIRYLRFSFLIELPYWVICVNTGRRFIGIELDEVYFNIAKKRIEEAQARKDGDGNGLH